MRSIKWMIIVLFLTVLADGASAQIGLKYVAASAGPTVSVSPGGTAAIKLVVVVKPGFHINADIVNDPDLIPTSLKLAPVAGLSFGPAIFPKPKVMTSLSLSEKPLLVLTGTELIRIPVSAAKGVKSGRYIVPIALQYQGCNATACFPPHTDKLSAYVSVK